MGFSLADFALDLRKCVSPAHHVWVGSGWSTCAPLADTAAGVKGCFSPPFAAGDLSLSFTLVANGHVIPDTGNKGKEDCGLLFSGARWQPDAITRTGTYHYRVEETLLSLGVESALVPLVHRAGVLVVLTVTNRGDCAVPLEVQTTLDPGHPKTVPLGEWEFMPPQPSEQAALPVGDSIWENDQVRVTLLTEADGEGELAPGGVRRFWAAAVLTLPGETVTRPASLLAWQQETRAAWEARVLAASDGVPTLESDIPGLVGYYNRSLASGLVSLWEKEAFVVQPFPATSGIDGGSICCYPWDVAGYSAETLIMLLGDKTLDFLSAMLQSGIDRHISMSLDGGGLGWCSYSYSLWSLFHLYWMCVTMTGSGEALFDDMLRVLEGEEARLEERDGLKDYGRQHNLLEMRTCGYEYLVASPNAERAWCYDRLADLADHFGRPGAAAWREKADAIRKAIRDKLWDADAGWFRCIHPGGHVEMVYSIQAYDVLRNGACDAAMQEKLLRHVRDGAFLGDYGVSSVSAEDALHYELNDPDWSGAGSYGGDGPNLAETLWGCGCPELAWDVLKRHFWMGRQLPYYPQEHYCDKPGVPANKRANIIAGVAGLQAVLYGMAGLCPKLDGSIVAMPQPPEDGYVNIRGYRHRGSTIDVEMKPGWTRIVKDGSVVYEGTPKRVVLE